MINIILKDVFIFYFRYQNCFYLRAMLSKSCKYAIRAVLYLTKQPDKKIGSKEIAEKLDIPAPFLAKTLQELTKKQIISSLKGPNGGFFLSEENQQRKIMDIINCIDGDLVFDRCFLGKAECNSKNPCVIHSVYVSFKEKLLEQFSKKNLLTFANEEVALETLLKRV